jgi:hypothetical protein
VNSFERGLGVIEGAEKKEGVILDADKILLSEGQILAAKPERETSEKKQRVANWRRFIFSGLTFMALMMPLGAALAQGPKEETELYVDVQKDRPIKKEKTARLRDMIKSEDMQAKVRKVVNVFGSASDVINPVEATLVYLEELQKAEKEGVDDPTLYQNLADYYDNYFDKQGLVRRADQRSAAEPNVEHFSEKWGTTDSSGDLFVKFLLEQDVPKEFLSNVDVVRFVPQAKKNEVYEVAAEAYSAGTEATVWRSEHDSVVKVYAGTPNIQLDDVLVHETAHENDFATSDRLTANERVDFLMDIGSYLMDKDRPKLDYIDHLVPEVYKRNQWDEKQMRYRQAKELWAVCVEDYFSSPREFEKQFPSGYALVEKWLHAMNGKGIEQWMKQRKEGKEEWVEKGLNGKLPQPPVSDPIGASEH